MTYASERGVSAPSCRSSSTSSFTSPLYQDPTYRQVTKNLGNHTERPTKWICNHCGARENEKEWQKRRKYVILKISQHGMIDRRKHTIHVPASLWCKFRPNRDAWNGNKIKATREIQAAPEISWLFHNAFLLFLVHDRLCCLVLDPDHIDDRNHKRDSLNCFESVLWNFKLKLMIHETATDENRREKQIF